MAESTVSAYGAIVLLSVVLAPLVASCAALFLRGRTGVVLHGLFLAVNVLTVVALAIAVARHGPARYVLGGWEAPLGVSLEANGSAVVLLLLTALVAGASALHSHASDQRAKGGAPLFWPFYYALWASLNALFVAGDIFNVYIALELISLSAVVLVAQSGDRNALIAALRYLFIALFGSILYLAGVVLVYGAGGTLDFALLAGRLDAGVSTWTAVAFMTCGLIVKTALFPFHFWLPPAHSHAVAPISAVLSGLVVKASFFVLVKLWFGPFAGLEAGALHTALGMLGAGAVIWGSLAAWRQTRLKLMVAYSTVAQIGYLFLIFPLFESSPSTAWNATFAHALSHGVAKAAMFLAAGNVLWALKSDEIGMLSRLGGQLRLSLMAIALAGISLVGLPPAGGFIGKWLFLQAAIQQAQWEWVILIIAGSFIAALYVFRLLGAIMAAPAQGEQVRVRRVPLVMEVTALALGVLAFVLGIGAALPLSLIEIGVPFAVAANPRAEASGGWLLIAILLSSLVPGVLVFFLDDRLSWLRTGLSLAGSTLKVAFVVALIGGVHAGYGFEARIAFLPGLDLVLRADPLTLQFVTLSAGLWLITTIYAIGYLEDAAERSRFFGFFNLSVAASAGIALSGNLLTFLFFYEFLTLTTYPLVVHRGTPAAIAAGRTYLIYTIAGGAAVLLGTVWLHALGADLAFSANNSLAALNERLPLSVAIIFALLVGGMGVKAALVPMHGWLPRAMVAPAPVSALLHAVAVVKAGVFGVIRVLYDVFGVSFAHVFAGTSVLAFLAAFTIVYGSVRALYQDDLKKRLAYSTVSQVSYIVLGASLASPIATIGALVHIVHQGLMKITLFFCAGNLAEVRGIHKISEMNGIGRVMPWTMAAFTVAAFGMIGLPPIAGFVSKWYLAGGGIDAGGDWVLIVLAASGALNAAYFLPILHAAWFKPLSGRPQRLRPDTWWIIVPPVLTAGLSISAGLFAGMSFSPLGWAKVIAERNYHGVAPEP